MTISFTRAKEGKDLIQILEIQKNNLPINLSKEESNKEGFVTVCHTLQQLQAMNDECPHIVAKVDDTVVGYALCMTRSFADDIEVLKPMFKEIEKMLPEEEKYIVMGQICIAKEYRKKGIFKNLYAEMKKAVKEDYYQIITEVDSTNQRSLNAHRAIGFTLLKTYISNQQEWQIVSLK